MTSEASQGRAGMTLAVVSAATFGTSGTFATSLIDAGWSPGAAVLARIAVAALVLTVPGLMALRGRWGQLRRSLGRVAGYGLFAVAGCPAVLLQRHPADPDRGRAAAGVPGRGAGRRLDVAAARPAAAPAHRGGRGAALAGLGLVLDLSGSARLSLIGVMWGLLAAVGLAAYFVLSARRRR